MNTIPANLKEEFEFYLANQKKLLEEYKGKFLIIKDKKVVAALDTELEAYQEATKQFKLGTFLIQLCQPGEESHTEIFHSRVILN